MSAITMKKINVEPLRADVREAVRGFAAGLMEGLGDNLKSISVVGSVLTEDFHPKYSDINTVVVVDAVDVKVLKNLSELGKSMGRQRFRAPLLMTPEYICRSLDVFGVEFLEFQLNHATVYGQDPFSALTFNKECVRLQCERELRTAQIQLWEGYIRGVGHHKSVEPLLVECVRKLLALFRGLLWLMEVDRPREARPTLEMAGMAFNFDGRWVASLLNLRQRERRFGRDQIDGMFRDVCEVVELLCRKVDQLPMKS